MNPMTPWAQDDIDKVRYQASEYRRRRDERAALEARVQAADGPACGHCGYLSCPCEDDRLRASIRERFYAIYPPYRHPGTVRVYTSDPGDDALLGDGPPVSVIADACGATYSRPIRASLDRFGVGAISRDMFSRNYFASFEAPQETR